ncbi:unnamed protein product [Orchesella dallaii]
MDKEGVEHRCRYCGQLAKFKCHDCDLDMCQECSVKHPDMVEDGEMGRNCHQILQLDSEPPQRVKRLTSVKRTNSSTENGDGARYLYCPSHAGQTLRFFCKDCDTAICSSCTDIEHGRHTTVRAMDAVLEEKIRLQELMDSVQSNVDKLQDAIKMTEEGSNALNDQKDRVISDIDETFDNLLQQINHRRLQLKEDAAAQFNLKLDQLQKSKNLLSTHLQDVKECCSLTEKALSHENETEILFVKKQIGERLEEYAKMCLSPESISKDSAIEFDKQSMDSVDIDTLGRVFSNVQKGWALSGDVVESRCVPIQRRHFLRLHMSANNSADIHFNDIQVTCSTKDVVFTFEQPMESDSRTFTIRFLVSRVGPFGFSISVKGQFISGSPFQFYAYDADDGVTSSSPSPHHMNGTNSRGSPTGSGYLPACSRIPRANGGAPSLSPRSRVSTPTKKFHNGHGHAMRTNGSVHGLGSSSRRSNTLEDDLILKIGQRGRGKGEFTNPQGVAATPQGRLVVTDSNNQCVQIFDNTGECKVKFGVRGRTVGQLQRPVGVAVLPSNGNIAIADYDNKWISMYDQTGKFMSRIGHGKLLGPKGITVDSNGLIYVVDNKASCILVFQPNGKLVHKFGSRGNDEGQFAGPHFVAVNSKGNIIVTDFHNHCVKVFDSERDYLYSFGTNGEGNGQFNAPTGVAVDKNDNILVADWGNSRIQIFDSQGSFLSYVSTSVEPLYGPQGLTVTPDGYVAIADSGNHCVKLYKYSY